jgi:hypothetical protein
MGQIPSVSQHAWHGSAFLNGISLQGNRLDNYSPLHRKVKLCNKLNHGSGEDLVAGVAPETGDGIE